MRISIIIPNFNGGQHLLNCLESIYRNPSSLPLEVIIVDNNSEDRSQIQAKNKFPQIKIIQLVQNKGFAKAVNIGISKTKADYLFLLNNDITLGKNTVEELVKTLESDKQNGIASGKITDRQGELSLPGFKLHPYLGYMVWGKTSQNHQQEVDWISGSSMMIKRAVINKIGLFDESYYFYFEDTDFCIRAKRAGFKSIYQPKAKIIHLDGFSSGKIKKSLLNRYWYQGKFHCILKNGTSVQILTSLLIQAIVFPYKVWFKRDGTGIAQIKGLIWSLKNR